MKKGWNNIEIKKLVKADWNYKEENQILTEKLLANFKRNGQIESIIVRELDTGFFEVVNGNHRLDVMKMLEYKEAHCYNFGKISQLQMDSISVDSGAGNFKNIIAATFSTADTGGVDNRIIATNANSGSIFTVNAGTDANSTIYLPDAPVDGWNAKFICNHPSDTHTITITENGESTPFMGLSVQGGDAVEHTGSTSAVIQNDDFKLGDWFECTWDGTIWHITGQFDTASSMAVS